MGDDSSAYFLKIKLRMSPIFLNVSGHDSAGWNLFSASFLVSGVRKKGEPSPFLCNKLDNLRRRFIESKFGVRPVVQTRRVPSDQKLIDKRAIEHGWMMQWEKRQTSIQFTSIMRKQNHLVLNSGRYAERIHISDRG